MSLNVFGSDGGIEPFEPPAAPADGERFRVRDYIGSAAVVSIKGPKEATGDYGTSTVMVADVAVLTDEGLKEFPSAWLTGSAVVQDLTPMVGRTLAVKFGKAKTKDGKREFYKIEAPSAKEIADLQAAIDA